jgi:hypothetical protein
LIFIPRPIKNLFSCLKLSRFIPTKNVKTGLADTLLLRLPPFDIPAPDEYYLLRLRLEASKKYGSMHDPLKGANYGKTY